MAIIDQEGLFGGDRLRRCSNMAQLNWPRLFLASDGFARLEINYARIVGRAYPTFNPIPSEAEIQAWIQEYASNYLLFLYEVDGRLWGQWDTRPELLPRYKTAADRRSPEPPENPIREWKRLYRAQNTAFPKCFGNISAALPQSSGKIAAAFLHGGGVGVGENTCPSQTDGPVCDPQNSTAAPRATSSGEPEPEPGPFFSEEMGLKARNVAPLKVNGLETPNNQAQTKEHIEQQFLEWWELYPRKVCKRAAADAYRKAIKNGASRADVLEGLRRQLPELLQAEPKYRPHPKTWLNERRWEDETGAQPWVRAEAERRLL